MTSLNVVMLWWYVGQSKVLNVQSTVSRWISIKIIGTGNCNFVLQVLQGMTVKPRLSADCSLSHGTGCVGFFCPCFLFGKNAEFLGSGTLTGSCLTHFVLWALFNSVCCLLTDGTLLALPGFFISCYACGYRRALRSKYNLQVQF